MSPCIITCAALALAGGDAHDNIKVTTKRPDDAVEIKVEKGATLFLIKCPKGNSGGTLELLDKQWPKTVVLRFHLSGLEQFTLDNGKVKLGGGVRVENGKTSLRLYKQGDKGLLDEKSPYWMEVRAIGADGKPVQELPVKGGYIELTLPRVLLEDNPKTIQMTWIDVLR
jgi:hypothetical protein